MKLTELQLSQVDAQIKRLIRTDSYYGKIYKEAGITGVSSQESVDHAIYRVLAHRAAFVVEFTHGAVGFVEDFDVHA